jgi:putative ABC transport system permease protein
MSSTAQIIVTSITQALHELRANKLRTSLSLLGITIGIFCIIGVLTVLDSMERNLRESMAALGDDVLYIGRQPWMPDPGEEYKWWEYLQRRPLSETELRAIRENASGVQYISIYDRSRVTVKYNDVEMEEITGFAVSEDFEKMQTVEVKNGRYFSMSELAGGNYVTLIGSELADKLFTGDPVDKTISFHGKKFLVIGVFKKSGQNMAGFDFDDAVVFPYSTAKAITNLSSMDWGNDPMIMVKADEGVNVDDMKYQVEGILRAVRKVKPGEKNNFSINQLSQVSAQMDMIFASVNMIGSIIGGFSLIVGAFGIANIMFVTVKERTKVIGLKKAIGARPRSILSEFLIEAIALCIIGGLIGITIVLALSLILTYGVDFEVTLSMKNFLVGIGISAAVGILAGYIPARSASRLDPVVAIRSN